MEGLFAVVFVQIFLKIFAKKLTLKPVKEKDFFKVVFPFKEFTLRDREERHSER